MPAITARLQKYIQPYGAALLSSKGLYQTVHTFSGLSRRLRGTQPVVEVFLDRNDPYSQLLAQVLPPLQQRFAIELKIWEVSSQAGEMFPEAELWKENAIKDAQALAELYGLEPPFAEHIPTITTSTAEGEARRKQLGHYQSAMIWFEGEWFWGLDRLDHLERRLLAIGCQNSTNERVHFDKTCQQSFIGQAADVVDRSQPLRFYFSMRSPYSYLALERVVAMAGHYQVPLDIRPLLPMVMRGVPVPSQKKMYIFRDTSREARKQGIPYGFVADPLGKGVENCYALFDYARTLGKGKELLLSYGRAVNAEGVHSDTEAGLKLIVVRAGLDWEQARKCLADDSWRAWAEVHRSELYKLGLWGVPSFAYKEGQSCWGQDRLWLVERWLLGKA
ncbi:DsbA family protein [Parendozoicomonas haliclonae]|uniref:2-hydroxychromene-2-carboxylate isomerase n=1 Tax=Parendozoicomonas haliclonae TaxID=1960125 RepID=A0A1X7AHF8_9GAMM|nr:DsbA family protein [Parendozoicomonas haliclonae]SMA41692.1 2-hydroxychromene-2-carboxylate isomerase [Parendozoicomonas haliclonae]